MDSLDATTTHSTHTPQTLPFGDMRYYHGPLPAGGLPLRPPEPPRSPPVSTHSDLPRHGRVLPQFTHVWCVCGGFRATAGCGGFHWTTWITNTTWPTGDFPLDVPLRLRLRVLRDTPPTPGLPHLPTTTFAHHTAWRCRLLPHPVFSFHGPNGRTYLSGRCGFRLNSVGL